MAAAVREHPVVLGEAGANMVERRFSRGVEPPAKIAWLGSDVGDLLPSYPYAITPLPILAGAAHGLGLVSIQPEVDGIVRRAPRSAWSVIACCPAWPSKRFG
jgi:adenylate cyclase